MLFEVNKSTAFGFTRYRYKTKWDNSGATWVENRARRKRSPSETRRRPPSTR
jgi:hypothetical protein